MLFVQQIFVKELLCARHYKIVNKMHKSSCSHEEHRIMDRTENKEVKIYVIFYCDESRVDFCF